MEQIAVLFDHLVGGNEHSVRNARTKRLGHLEADDKFEFRWLLDRQIGGADASERFACAGCMSVLTQMAT